MIEKKDMLIYTFLCENVCWMLENERTTQHNRTKTMGCHDNLKGRIDRNQPRKE